MNQKQEQAVNNLIEAYNKLDQARDLYSDAVLDYREALGEITPALDLPEVFAIVRNSTVYTVFVDRTDGDHKVESYPLLATAEVAIDEAFGDDNQTTRHINVAWRQE